jgi:type II secretory pathway pseudopilin PulG
MKRTGFTVIELLISVGILLLLAALLFPVFTHARRAGQRSDYVQRLRQVDLAHRLYVDAYGLPGVTSVGLGLSLKGNPAEELALLPPDRNPGGLANVLASAYSQIIPNFYSNFSNWTDLLPKQTIIMGNRGSGIEFNREVMINNEMRTARRAIPYMAFLLPPHHDFSIQREDPYRTVAAAFLGGSTALRMTDAGSVDVLNLSPDRAGPSSIFLSDIVEPSVE